MTPIYHYDVVQGTDEWRDLRADKWTASNAAVIMGGLDTDGLDKLVKKVAWGRVYGAVLGGFKSAAMEHGNKTEPEAVDWYSFETGETLTACGLVEHSTIPYVAWSPDALIGERRAIEAKCQLEMAWMDTKKSGKVPSQYRWQCRWAAWVGMLECIDYVTYHPKSGGIIIQTEITESEKQQMEERVSILEPRVSEWIEIISDKNLN